MTALDHEIGIEEYLIWSTAATPLLFLIVGRVGADVMLGYPFILANSFILLQTDRLKIHPNHIIAILGAAGFSLIGSYLAGTPLISIITTVTGVSVISIYFFSALAVLGPSVPRWMDLYARVAFGVAVFGIIAWIVARVLQTGDGRLKSFYTEPSNFVFTTLPALGYFINCWLQEKRYGAEAAIFILSYILSDSSLGFVGLLLVVLLAYSHKLRGWQVLVAMLLTGGFLAGLYFGSANVRLRVQDTAVALATQNVSKANGSTYAFLSNAYVAGRALWDYPVTGVGLGGYSALYDVYISDLGGIDKTDSANLELNRADANSLFFRVAAELGLPGLVTLLSFLVICGRVRDQPYRKIRNALLPYMLVRMSRYGAYFSVEIYFFVALYLFNYLNYRTHVRTGTLHILGAPSRATAQGSPTR